ncbi:hypothetical protein QSV34_11320 [Porticoccus sp. W117]|uniref:hypothetical protein n=1 Tax=Porticoccus sp. W117 TaxID=3054777 RepID=UPI00259AC628|nr:hypothetical protein [Porticoccus sp. W117]MDM3871936.1 hypothetical protein [Porticoccus sp. W117]
MIRFIFLILFSVFAIAETNHPDCAGKDRWPAAMAFVHLKNEGLAKNDDIDFSLTSVKRLSSQEIEPGLFTQIHEVTFFEKNGKTITVITNNNASHEECSMSGVEVYVISKKLGAK